MPRTAMILKLSQQCVSIFQHTRKRLVVAAGLSAISLGYAGYHTLQVVADERFVSARKLRPGWLVYADRPLPPSNSISRNDVAVTMPSWKTLKTRAVKGVQELPFNITLLQYETCPYCSKVCAFLDYYGLPYNLVEVNPLFRDELKLVTDEYRKVPLMIISDKHDPSHFIFVPESTLIVSALKSLLSGFVPPPPVTSTADVRKTKNEKVLLGRQAQISPVDIVQEVLKFYPQYSYDEAKKTSWMGKIKQVKDYRNKYYVMYGEEQDHMYLSKESAAAYREEVQWREWVDQKFLHSLAPNIYRTLGESVRTFRYLSEEGHWDELFPVWKRELVVYVGAVVMWGIGKKVAKRHELSSDPRYSMYNYASVWLKAVGNKRQFMGGKQPNLADLAVYGVLSAIEGTDAFRDLCRETKMGEWYNVTKQYVLTHAGAAEARNWSNLSVLNAAVTPSAGVVHATNKGKGFNTSDQMTSNAMQARFDPPTAFATDKSSSKRFFFS